MHNYMKMPKCGDRKLTNLTIFDNQGFEEMQSVTLSKMVRHPP